ncbi:hypothetical protein Maes01_01648 [Microbulbifer aestuariivivens]|uniref:Lipase modulator n=1 Tax=Microbulbifer aestuariivivens TaxID=1908308 RepID=A0ABP9WR90_9GAMM
MHKMRNRLALGALMLAMMAAVLFYVTGMVLPDTDPTSAHNGSAHTLQQTEYNEGEPEAIANTVGDLLEPGVIFEDALSALLQDPRVEKYLSREADKKALRSYFAGEPGALSDREAWELIERIENEGRVIAYEGLAIKLAWLERNSGSKAEYDERAAAIIAEYRQRAHRQLQAYDPYREVPGFARYKEMEVEILREVQQMASFPDGLSRQEYLRQRLQTAREEAYGN